MSFLKNLFSDPKAIARTILFGLLTSTAKKEIVKKLAFKPDLKEQLKALELTDSQIAKAEVLINNAHADEALEWIEEKAEKL